MVSWPHLSEEMKVVRTTEDVDGKGGEEKSRQVTQVIHYVQDRRWVAVVKLLPRKGDCEAAGSPGRPPTACGRTPGRSHCRTPASIHSMSGTSSTAPFPLLLRCASSL